jgi:catechol 2,3-dioxygenase-like lactoylglutathione lyase family enzyme
VRNARFAHTNLIARDWRALAAFYIDVFGCVPVPPERDYRGAALDALTGIRDAHQFGVHLRLPGYGETGPTLEIFSFDSLAPKPETRVNRLGYGHIAFEVPDVAEALALVTGRGGRVVGEIVTLTTRTNAHVTVCYATDPEENVIELQSWDYRDVVIASAA